MKDVQARIYLIRNALAARVRDGVRDLRAELAARGAGRSGAVERGAWQIVEEKLREAADDMIEACLAAGMRDAAEIQDLVWQECASYLKSQQFAAGSAGLSMELASRSHVTAVIRPHVDLRTRVRLADIVQSRRENRQKQLWSGAGKLGSYAATGMLGWLASSYVAYAKPMLHQWLPWLF